MDIHEYQAKENAAEKLGIRLNSSTHFKPPLELFGAGLDVGITLSPRR